MKDRARRLAKGEKHRIWLRRVRRNAADGIFQTAHLRGGASGKDDRALTHVKGVRETRESSGWGPVFLELYSVDDRGKSPSVHDEDHHSPLVGVALDQDVVHSLDKSVSPGRTIRRRRGPAELEGRPLPGFAARPVEINVVCPERCQAGDVNGGFVRPPDEVILEQGVVRRIGAVRRRDGAKPGAAQAHRRLVPVGVEQVGDVERSRGRVRAGGVPDDAGVVRVRADALISR